MNVLVIALRLIHVMAGVLWVGAALVNTFFLAPSVAATGESGQTLMTHLVGQARFGARVTLASYVTVLAGALLYWIDSRAFTSAWTTSGPGIGFGLGALAGIAGLGFGQVVGKSYARIAAVAGQVQGTPNPAQHAALELARRRMTSAGRVSTVLLVAALACMATARYWFI
ncbi:MAG TPA: hypothetical protein VLL49_07355 [Anaerolineales bacterium]|nr:hypothetical protein [Anaerolineales bacterium]